MNSIYDPTLLQGKSGDLVFKMQTLIEELGGELEQIEIHDEPARIGKCVITLRCQFSDYLGAARKEGKIEW